MNPYRAAGNYLSDEGTASDSANPYEALKIRKVVGTSVDRPQSVNDATKRTLVLQFLKKQKSLLESEIKEYLRGVGCDSIEDFQMEEQFARIRFNDASAVQTVLNNNSHPKKLSINGAQVIARKDG